MFEQLVDVFRNTVAITSFVVIIMLFIELLHVFTQGKWNHWLVKMKPLQVFLATLLGLIPGCFGGFAVVSLWTHGAVSFGSLVAAMIAGIGDEAFVMLVRMPEQTLWLIGLLLPLSIGVGLLIDRLKISIKLPQMDGHLVIHEHESVPFKDSKNVWKNNFKPVSFTRVLLISGMISILTALIFGYFEHDHHDHTIAAASIMPVEESWFNSLFIVLGIIVLITFFIVSDHFLEEHLWKHVILQHVPKIFIWTFIALILINLFMDSVNMQEWVHNNAFWMLLLAVLVGLIPESGPHLIFVTLFLGGTIPFSILLANAITQDGHASLPLLAESKRGFLAVKLINALVGLVVGGAVLLAGY